MAKSKHDTGKRLLLRPPFLEQRAGSSRRMCDETFRIGRSIRMNRHTRGRSLVPVLLIYNE